MESTLLGKRATEFPCIVVISTINSYAEVFMSNEHIVTLNCKKRITLCKTNYSLPLMLHSFFLLFFYQEQNNKENRGILMSQEIILRNSPCWF